MTTTTLPAPASTDLHHDYRLTKVKRMDARCGIAFSGVLTHQGKPVADVHQHGNGGQAFVHFYDGAVGPAWKAFEQAARAIFGEDSYEPTESLLWRLESADQMSRMRNSAFVFGQAEVDRFWSEEPDGGTCRKVTGLKAAELPAYLRAHHGDKEPFVWSKAAATFVPVDLG